MTSVKQLSNVSNGANEKKRRNEGQTRKIKWTKKKRLSRWRKVECEIIKNTQTILKSKINR